MVIIAYIHLFQSETKKQVREVEFIVERGFSPV